MDWDGDGPTRFQLWAERRCGRFHIAVVMLTYMFLWIILPTLIGCWLFGDKL